MKVAGVLLSLLVIFLNAIPCCWDECPEDDAVVHAEEKPNSQDACSPFLSCGGCTGFILEQELPDILSSVISPYQIVDKHENPLFNSDYSRIIWAPPKEN